MGLSPGGGMKRTPKERDPSHLNRKQFKQVSALTASWTNSELQTLSSVVSARKNVYQVFPAEKITALAPLFDETGIVTDNVVWLLVQDVVRGHLLEREFAAYAQTHPYAYGPKKRVK